MSLLCIFRFSVLFTMSSQHCKSIITREGKSVYEKNVNFTSEPILVLLRRQNAVCALVLIVLHFTVHIIDSDDSQQIHLADMYAKLHRPKEQERGRHFPVSRSKFFSFDLCLDIQSLKLDDLRQHLIDGKSPELLQPFIRRVRDSLRIRMLCHDIADVLEKLQREAVERGGHRVLPIDGFLEVAQILVDIPMEPVPVYS